MKTLFVITILIVATGCQAPEASADPPSAGDQIAFQSRRDGAREIYTIAPDGSKLKRITNHRSHDAYPSWSPDRTKFVFTSERVGWWKVWSMDADGSNVRQLTDSASWDSYPKFSPDGTRVVFASDRDGNGEIYVMNTDGSNETNLTSNGAGDSLRAHQALDVEHAVAGKVGLAAIHQGAPGRRAGLVEGVAVEIEDILHDVLLFRATMAKKDCHATG